MKALKKDRQSQNPVSFQRAGALRFLVESLENRCMLADILGTASAFAVLGASAVTNTGLTNITGDVGVSPGAAITGFPPGVVTNGSLHSSDAASSQAHSDLVAAYGVIAGEASTSNLSGTDLGGLTLTPGVYHFDTSAALTGTLTLDAQGNPNARFDFQIGTTLITAANSAVDVINSAQADNVYFQLGTSATLAASTAFEGNILADQSITLASGASLLDGRALALNAAVTMSTNQITVPQPANIVTTPVTTAADISVSNTTTAGTVAAGDTITYTVTVANAGPSDAQTVALSDLVPTNTTFVSATQTSGPAFTLTDPAVGGTGTISGTLGTLATGGSASFTIVARVSPSAADGATIANTANVSTATTDPDSTNNSQTATTTVQRQADVSVTDSTTASVLAGDTITYTVTVANNGPGDAQTVALSDLVPANTTFVSNTQTSGPAFTLSNPAVGGTGTMGGTIGTLASGASASFTIVALVSPSAADGATIADTANVSTATTDPNSANNSQTATTNVQRQADVSVTNSTTAVSVLAGNRITYTVTVANNGPGDAQTVALSDLVPTNTTFVSATQTSGSAFTLTDPAVGRTGTISGTIGTLASGASASFTVVARVSPSAADGATITNTANVSTATTDPNSANNSQTASTNVQSQADVSVTNTSTAVSVLAGNNITYTVSVANAGPSDARTVVMSDLVPANTTFASATQISGPAFTLTDPAVGGTGTISGTIASLASGASASFTIVDRVLPSTPNGATITNTANVSTAATDPNLVNNSRSFTVGGRGSTPTIVSVISPVISTSVRPGLSVLGADTGLLGEAGLTYTWSVAHAPAGAKPAKFSVNGTNSAKDPTIRVLKDGTYQLSCVITNSSGNSVTASVELVIKQLATRLLLTPHAQTISAGASLQYAGVALDQFGYAMRTTPTTTYAVNSGDGTIDDNGLFTAGQNRGHAVIQISVDDLIGTLGATILR